MKAPVIQHDAITVTPGEAHLTVDCSCGTEYTVPVVGSSLDTASATEGEMLEIGLLAHIAASLTEHDYRALWYVMDDNGAVLRRCTSYRRLRAWVLEHWHIPAPLEREKYATGEYVFTVADETDTSDPVTVMLARGVYLDDKATGNDMNPRQLPRFPFEGKRAHVAVDWQPGAANAPA